MLIFISDSWSLQGHLLVTAGVSTWLLLQVIWDKTLSCLQKLLQEDMPPFPCAPCIKRKLQSCFQYSQTIVTTPTNLGQADDSQQTPPNSAKDKLWSPTLSDTLHARYRGNQGPGSRGGSKLRTPRTLTRLMQQHRENER